MRPRLLVLLAILATASIAVAGCGGGGGEGSTAASAPPPRHQAQPGPPAAAFHPKPHQDSGGGSQQFVVKGADNSVQEFGAEADSSELRQAATSLHGFLDARVARNWAAACTYLDAATKQSFAQLGSAPVKSCAASLSALTGKTPVSTLREAAVADAGSLRSEGDQAFLIYRGDPKGTVYGIAMAREGGAWKVSSISAVPLS